MAGQSGERATGRPPQIPTGTVTFLFTDIEGSTRLVEETGASYAALLDDHRRLLRRAFAAHGGYEVDTQGDAFFVAFTSPTAGVAAAGAAQRALAAHAWPQGRRVLVRMGLHTGEATATGHGYVGLDVHRAARIAAVAHGGQVLLSEATAALVANRLPEGLSMRDLGEHSLKDFSRPARLFQLDVPGLRHDFPPPRTLSPPHRLPAPPGGFVGREEDVAAVAALLRDDRTRLVTLTGPGGVGKSRLALEAARTVAADFPGGVAFVSLAAVADPGLVLGAIAEAVGARPEGGVGALDAIVAAVGERRKLLLVDNFEQVNQAAPDLAALLERSPAIVALVTSRHVLRLRPEHEYRVAPLPQPAAVELFAQRAGGARRGFALTEASLPAVTEICRLLDGLPLAIELAAARVRMLPPEALIGRLRERLDALGQGAVDLPERQRTLRTTMEWSYDLLEPAEQALLARLGVFVGGWTLDAAEAVCGRRGEPDVFDTLAELVDKSLVVAEGDVAPEPRFHMLEVVRSFASVKLRTSPDRVETERRHTEWMAHMAAGLLGTRGGEHRIWVERLDRERPNLRAVMQRALDAGDLALVARLIRDLFLYLAHRDAEMEAVAWLDQGLARAHRAPPAVRARLLVVRSLAAALGDFAEARALVAEARSLLPDDADHAFDHAIAATTDAFCAVAVSGPDEAVRMIEEATARLGALGIELGLAYMEVMRGNVALDVGDLEAAARHYETTAELADNLGDDAMRGRALSLLGLTLLARGDVDRARGLILDGATANLQGGQATSIAHSLDALAAAALAHQRPAVAAQALASSAAIRDHIGQPPSRIFQPMLDELAHRCRALLGDERYETAVSVGRRWEPVVALRRTLDALE